MPENVDTPTFPARPRQLLTQNRELKAIGVWNWTLPAWAGRMPDGRTYNTCPSVGICTLAPGSAMPGHLPVAGRARQTHHANLTFVLDLPGWQPAILTELAAKRFTGAWIRIHDAGDFFDDYLHEWLRICRTRPDLHFYAYTKEVDRFRRLVEPDPPPNFLWVYSYGGTQDRHLDPAVDRVADVFPDEQSIAEAGFSSQDASDLLAVLGPRLVGIPANRIRTFLKAMAGRRFSDWQAEQDTLTAARRRHHERSDGNAA